MAIGVGWVDGAWIDAGWDTNAWDQGSGPSLIGSISHKSVASNSGTYTYELGNNFFNATSYSISPAVEAGWTFNTSTGQLVIDTDADGTFGPYTVTGTNGSSVSQNAFLVTVGAVGENLSQTPAVAIKQAVAFEITDIERDY
jgi:hypothetical protein